MTQCCNPAGKITLYQGINFGKTWRWAASPLVYKAISASPLRTPLRFTVTGHGLPNGWPVAFRDVGGFAAAPNATEWPPLSFYKATVVDVNTIELNDVDGFALGAYTSGGVLAYYTPVSLSGLTGTLNVYNAPPVLGVAPVPALSVALALDDTAKTINAALTAVQTAALLKPQYSYDVSVTDGSGVVTLLERGTVDSKVRGT